VTLENGDLTTTVLLFMHFYKLLYSRLNFLSRNNSILYRWLRRTV